MAAKDDPNQPITRNVLDKALEGVVETLLQGMDSLYARFKGDMEGEVRGLREEMNAGFAKLDRRLDSVESELTYVKGEVNGIKAELSATPSRREFNDLKERVDKRLPLA